MWVCNWSIAIYILRKQVTCERPKVSAVIVKRYVGGLEGRRRFSIRRRSDGNFQIYDDNRYEGINQPYEFDDEPVGGKRIIDAAGLPRRSWYRHLLYAPGFYTGYGAKTVPGVREGIEQGRYDEAEGEVVRVSRALTRLVALIDSASVDLEALRQ